MNATLSLLLAALAASTLLGWYARGARARRRGVARRGFVSIHADWRARLRGLRLVEPEDFLNLEALIVSGHPGRQVGRLTLGEGADAPAVYLKRETRVGWATRLANFLAGCGWVSRCVGEATVLEALERDGLPGPRWLATGEDDKGRAFLLVEEVPGAVPLASLLARLPDTASRRRLAARLGETLARLHEAGFYHRDLYAKHVLVRPDDFSIVLLDWQRAWRGAWIKQACRVRDLAALHATLADHLAGARDRLALVFAYLDRGRPATRGRRLRRLLPQVERQALRLRQKRHIREKRQPPTAEPQTWICYDGEALNVTPELVEATAGRPLDWLQLEQQPVGPAPASRRWLVLPDNRQVLLERQRGYVSLNERFRQWLLGRPIISAEQRRATLLWRLQRHGVPAPRVLAAGRRLDARGYQDSFLLCEPYGATVRLSAWLARAERPQRRRVLRQLGGLLARLHDACCYGESEVVVALAVRHEEGGPTLVLENVEGITPLRRPHPARASRDLSRVRAYLQERGCGPDDWREVLRGHAELGAADAPLVQATSTGDRALPSGDRAAVEPPSFWRRLRRGWRRIRQRPDWAWFAGPGWPERVMQVAVTDRFHAKQGRSTGRWRLPAPDGSGQRLVVYLKRHYALPFWRGLLATVWPGGNWSPAMLEYEHLEWARQQGVPVPATVAAGEFLGPWGKLESFLAVEELTDMLPLHEAIPLAAGRLPPPLFRRWKAGLVAEMARLARLLHDRRHFHKDLYLCHFFIHQDDLNGLPGEGAAAWRGRVSLIDLHRLEHHPWAWWMWQLKDLAQLLYSSDVPGVDWRDQLAFWMHYRGPGAQRWSSRWLRRLVVFKWRRYARHNQRRKKRLAEEGRDGPV
jgi:heptose I phosphotransferase